MRTRPAKPGDTCIKCHSVPFPGDTVYMTGLGGVECCRVDDWDKSTPVKKSDRT